MDIRKKLKNPFHRNKNVSLNGKTEVPKAWLKDTAKPHISREVRFKRSKIHVPMLKPFKRVIAGILLVMNFLISQLTLMSNPSTQWMAVLFFLNAFIIFDYLWKTRGGRT